MGKAAAAQSIRLGMGTEMIHNMFGKFAEEALRAVESEAVRLENLLSCFITGSDISRINMSAGLQAERVSLETYEVLTQAVRFSRQCQGMFDITIGPLVNL
jgi:FAD:protein FMN transferase